MFMRKKTHEREIAELIDYYVKLGERREKEHERAYERHADIVTTMRQMIEAAKAYKIRVREPLGLEDRYTIQAMFSGELAYNMVHGIQGAEHVFAQEIAQAVEFKLSALGSFDRYPGRRDG